MDSNHWITKSGKIICVTGTLNSLIATNVIVSDTQISMTKFGCKNLGISPMLFQNWYKFGLYKLYVVIYF